MIDHHASPGDSAVWVEGLDTPVAPLPSVTGCTFINLIKAEVPRLSTEADRSPRILTAACSVGAERARDLFGATYNDDRRRIGVFYRWAAPAGLPLRPGFENRRTAGCIV